jgi:hypothetical protein
LRKVPTAAGGAAKPTAAGGALPFDGAALRGVKLRKIDGSADADKTSPKGRAKDALDDLMGKMNQAKGVAKNPDLAKRAKIETAIKQCNEAIARLREEIIGNETLEDVKLQEILGKIEAEKKKLEEAMEDDKSVLTTSDILGKMAKIRVAHEEDEDSSGEPSSSNNDWD